QLLIRERGATLIVPVGELEWIEADSYYVRLHTGNGSRPRLLRERMSILEARLDPAQFLRTHRSAIVRTSSVRAIRPVTRYEHRTGSGRPGPRYWQQRADYRIAATLDPARNELHGRETIHYTNHAPEALSYLWLYLEQNICAPNSVTNLLNQPPLVFLGSSFDFSCQGFS